MMQRARDVVVLLMMELRLSTARKSGTPFSGWRFAVAVMIALGCYLQFDGSERFWLVIPTLFGVSLVLMTPEVAAAYGRERELGTLDQILATPVGSGSLFLAKLLGISLLTGALVLSGFGGMWLGALLGGETPMILQLDASRRAIPLIGMGIYGVLVGVTAGLLVSARSPSSIEAQKRLQAYGFGALLIFVVSGLGIAWLLSSDTFVDATTPAVRHLASLVDQGSRIPALMAVSVGALTLLAIGALGERMTRRERLWD